MTAIDFSIRSVELHDLPGWACWTFDIEIDLRTGRVRPDGFHETRPKGDRRKPPSKRPDVHRWIFQVAEAQCGHGADNAFIGLIVASRPDPRGTHNTAERAKTISMIYNAALNQGLSPKKAISAAYGYEVDTSGTIDEYSKTVHRWVKEARDLGFLPASDPAETRARRWPGGGGHPLETRRPEPMVPDPQRSGPYAGKTLTLYYRPVPPESTDGTRGAVADTEIVGRWSDGKPAENVDPLRAVTLAETVKHMNRLNLEFEKRYPGARIRSTMSAQGFQD